MIESSSLEVTRRHIKLQETGWNVHETNNRRNQTHGNIAVISVRPHRDVQPFVGAHGAADTKHAVKCGRRITPGVPDK